MMTPTPGLVIAAPRSGSGKTTVTLGLLRAFRREGLVTAGAKCGPDYIDPAFHAAASGRPGVNLDSWAMPDTLLDRLAASAAAGADLVICEGLMGLFDGVPAPTGHSGSSADIAARLDWPVLLVLDVGGQSQSAAAVALGCARLDPRIRIGGVVLNRVGSERHRRLATQAIEAIGLKVVGSLPRSNDVALPERHLGLVQAEETDQLDTLIDRMADFVGSHLDLTAIRALAGPTRSTEAAHAGPALRPPGQRIALARDAAFSFVYPHVLEGWRDAGAEIVPFSPLADEVPPRDCDVAWLPGGYPELHAPRLAAATRFLDGLRNFAATSPVHGECGGFMVLGRTLVAADGSHHAMAGLLDVATSFATRRMNLGYRDALLVVDGPLGPAGTRVRGHEFHYATILETGADQPFALVGDAYGGERKPDGARRGHVTGSFFHALAEVPG